MNRKIKAIIAICAMSFITLASSATSPALATIAESFPNASAEAIASIATLSSLTAVPFTILSGLLAGNKIKFRALASLGLFVVLLGGILPYFAKTIGQVLLGRAILGVGTGLLGPIVSTLTLSLFTGEDVAKQFSRNMMSTNLGAVIFQLLGGFLCNYNWRMPFAAYLAVAPVLITVLLLLPEPETVTQKDGGLAGSFKNGFSIGKILTGHVLFWSFLYCVYMLFFYPYVTEMSGIVQKNGWGNATTTAIILSIFTAMGVLGGYLFYPLNRRFGKYVLSIGFGIGAVSYLLLCLCSSAWSLTVVSCMYGLGYGMVGPAINYYLGIKLLPEYRAASVAASSLFCHIGSFGSPFLIGFFRDITGSTWDRFSFIVGACFYAAAALLFIILVSREKLQKKECASQ